MIANFAMLYRNGAGLRQFATVRLNRLPDTHARLPGNEPRSGPAPSVDVAGRRLRTSSDEGDFGDD